MALFTEEQTRDIREYVFQLDDMKRYKILSCIRMLQDDGADEDTLTSTMYYLAKNTKEIDRVHTALVNTSLVSGNADEGESEKEG
jgi:hypothetical protein